MDDYSKGCLYDFLVRQVISNVKFSVPFTTLKHFLCYKYKKIATNLTMLYIMNCAYIYMCFLSFCINFALIRVGTLLNYPVSRVGVYLRGRLIEALLYVN